MRLHVTRSQSHHVLAFDTQPIVPFACVYPMRPNPTCVSHASSSIGPGLHTPPIEFIRSQIPQHGGRHLKIVTKWIFRPFYSKLTSSRSEAHSCRDPSPATKSKEEGTRRRNEGPPWQRPTTPRGGWSNERRTDGRRNIRAREGGNPDSKRTELSRKPVRDFLFFFS